MKFFALLMVICMSLTCLDAEAKTYPKRHAKKASFKLKKKQALLRQQKKTLNPDASAPIFMEPEILPPAPEPVAVVEEPAPAPAPVVEEKKYNDFSFLTSVNLTMHHLRGNDTFDLPFKLTSGLGFGVGAEGTYSFMKNVGAFIRVGLDTLKYKDPEGFALSADKSILYNGAIGVRIGQNYVVGGEIYYGFMQDLYYYGRINTEGYLERASTSLIGFKAIWNIMDNANYGLAFSVGGKYLLGATKGSFEVGKTLNMGTGIDFKIGVSDSLFVLTGFDFEYRKSHPSTNTYTEYFGMFKLGFGRK